MRILCAGLLATLVLSLGCAQKVEKPSYAELVSIYTSEAQELDRLERKRADMVAEYEATLQPSGEQALEALTGMLGEMSTAQGDAPKLDATDPNELLDQAVANAENMQEQTGKLVDTLAKQSGAGPQGRAAIEAMYSDEFKATLAEIDAQIAKQRERVDRARADRDAAEAK